MSTRIHAKCDGSTSFRDRRDVQSSSSAFAVHTIHPKMSEKKSRGTFLDTEVLKRNS